MVSAEITLADGRRATITGPTREAVIEKAQWLADPQMGRIRQAGLGGNRGGSKTQRPYTFTLPVLGTQFSVGGPVGSLAKSTANIDDKTANTLAFGTMGALATGGTSFIPSVLGAGAGGGFGGGLGEAADPHSTPSSIAGASLRGGASMAAAEAAGFGLGALTNRFIAPNLSRYADPMKPLRQRVAASGLPQYLRGATSRVAKSLPQPLQRAARFAATPMGGEILEATAVPAATALFGPSVGIPLYLARAALAPGLLQRYLSNSALPNALIRGLGRRAVTTGIGAGLLDGSRKEDEARR